MLQPALSKPSDSSPSW